MTKPKTVVAACLALVVIAIAVSCGRKDQKTILDQRKVALLDEKRAFDGSPKTKSLEDELRTYGRSLEQELQKLMQEQSSSSEEKTRKIEEFRLKAQKEMDGKKEKMRKEVLSDVSKATAEVARKQGYAVVFESSALKQGIRRALFVSGERALADPSIEVESLQSKFLTLADMTDDVCRSLSKGSP